MNKLCWTNGSLTFRIFAQISWLNLIYFKGKGIFAVPLGSNKYFYFFLLHTISEFLNKIQFKCKFHKLVWQKGYKMPLAFGSFTKKKNYLWSCNRKINFWKKWLVTYRTTEYFCSKSVLQINKKLALIS
jgi:hypothetical protein